MRARWLRWVLLGVIALLGGLAAFLVATDPPLDRDGIDRRAELVLDEMPRVIERSEWTVQYCVDDAPPLLQAQVQEADGQALLAALPDGWIDRGPAPDGLVQQERTFDDWTAVLTVEGSEETVVLVTLDDSPQSGCS